uniref:Uncharacterized protein n=1 Tax=Rhizophora mucronata TaxID=61149 RepID=A0A2P2R3W0_RHIMU
MVLLEINLCNNAEHFFYLREGHLESMTHPNF